MHALLADPERYGGFWSGAHLQVEVPSALAKLVRLRRLRAKAFSESLLRFRRHLDFFNLVGLSDHILLQAALIVAARVRRAAGAGDAIHLAAAGRARERLDPAPLVVVSSDGYMLNLATGEGWPTFNPETDALEALLPPLGLS